jgi:hypothetical protein
LKKRVPLNLKGRDFEIGECYVEYYFCYAHPFSAIRARQILPIFVITIALNMVFVFTSFISFFIVFFLSVEKLNRLNERKATTKSRKHFQAPR